LDDQGRQPLRWLVKKHEPRVEQQGSRNCQHFLLAARQLASELGFALFEPGKQLEHAVDVPGSGARGRNLQIFKNSEAAEYLTAFRDVTDPKFGDPVRRPACRVLAKQLGIA